MTVLNNIAQAPVSLRFRFGGFLGRSRNSFSSFVIGHQVAHGCHGISDHVLASRLHEAAIAVL
jgi:hypothetical protein